MPAYLQECVHAGRPVVQRHAHSADAELFDAFLRVHRVVALACVTREAGDAVRLAARVQHRKYQRTVHATREQQADLTVCHQAGQHRVLDGGGQLLVVVGCARSVVAKIEIPALCHGPGRQVEAQRAACHHLSDALDVCRTSGARKHPAITQETVEVGLDESGSLAEVCKDRADLRGNAKRVCIRVVEQWLLAIPVACRREFAAALVKQAKGPHAVGLVEPVHAFGGKQGQQHLGIASGVEAQSIAREFSAQRAVVVDLSVVGERLVGASERLPRALAWVENRQAPVPDVPGNGDRSIGRRIRLCEGVFAGAVRTAMAQGGSRIAGSLGVDLASTLGHEKQSAHRLVSGWSGQ